MDIRKQLEVCKGCNQLPICYSFERLGNKALHSIKCLNCKVGYSSNDMEAAITTWNNHYGLIKEVESVLSRCKRCRIRPELAMAIVNKQLGYVIKGCDCFINMRLLHKSRALIIHKWNSLYGA